MTKTIEKKTYSDLFERIYNGTKTYDMRLADWDCQTGDIIKFVEIDAGRNLTGRVIPKQVGWVGKTKDTDYWPQAEVDKYGYQIISLLDEGFESPIKTS